MIGGLARTALGVDRAALTSHTAHPPKPVPAAREARASAALALV
jgi:hypothetical protein